MSLEAKDLRIGNYIKRASKDEILCIDLNLLIAIIKEPHLFSPVDITKGVLINLGLKPNCNYIKNLGVYFEDDKCEAYFTDNEFGYKESDKITIKGVHHLQNLYFDFGHELRFRGTVPINTFKKDLKESDIKKELIQLTSEGFRENCIKAARVIKSTAINLKTFKFPVLKQNK